MSHALRDLLQVADVRSREVLMFSSLWPMAWRPSLPALSLLVAASCVQAQPHVGLAASLDPLDPQAPVPAVIHESSLQRYQRWGNDPRVPWPQANDRVRRIGGWRAYAREAQQAQPAPAAPLGVAPAAGTPHAH